MIAAWVIGSRGMLGSALRRQLDGDSNVIVLTTDVDWEHPDIAGGQLRTAMGEWLSRRDAEGYELYWAAGASVTSSSENAIEREITVFEGFTQDLMRSVTSRVAPQPVSIMFASSAGGIYAGSPEPPFSELSPPHPVAPYGRAKLRMEKLLIDSLDSQPVQVLICRIANLYGEGQRLSKQQGFISHLCQSYLARVSIAIYVSLDTIRDYLHVDDAANLIVATSRLQTARRDHIVVKNIASMQPSSIAQLLQFARAVFKRRHGAVLASSPLAKGQVRDLRLASVVYPEIDEIPKRSLIVGMDQVRRSLLRQLQTPERSVM